MYATALNSLIHSHNLDHHVYFLPMNILSDSFTSSDTVCDIPLTCRYCFYHIRDLHRIRRYISLSVAKSIATAFIASRLDNCNSLLYAIASKDILEV